ncbi:MerR family transcriptional regulator [Nonomuraea sp. NPDC050202]|uniref:MerR family transcriptional regulator n=1 Tax=Nonomuraea sp. NPDC050202 TaxID=3155035 RepID=UPI0033FA3E17
MNTRRPMTLNEVRKRGLSYRRLDFWATRGWIRPTHAGGSGNTRVWPEAELRIADLMRRLTAAGLAADVAARAARACVEGDRLLVTIGPGVVLAIDTDLLAEEARQP